MIFKFLNKERMLYRNPHSGYVFGNLSGSVGILVKNSGNPDSTCDRSGQIYTCGIFYYFVPDMDSFEKSVSFYFLSYGSAGDIYKYL
jgi:hypothetical protein